MSSNNTEENEKLTQLINWINENKLFTEGSSTTSHIINIKTLKLHLIKINKDAIMSMHHPSPYLYTKKNYTTIPIPPEIVCLTNLKFLDLSYNKIEKVPLEIGELKSLKWLDLSINDIEELPISLNQLTKLKCLNLKRNLIPRDSISPAIFNKIKNAICPPYLLESPITNSV